ncbi:MAG: tripartite tricarboxylate transporter permease [Clostridiaceae bacterium]
MDGFIIFFQQLIALLNPMVIILMFISTTLGILIGALPGLTATMGIALLTGLTFRATDVQSFTVLMGIYVGGIYGGSLSAILLNVPGTASAAATAIEGHKLSLKGEAENAIIATRTASIIGTVIGMLALLIVTPLLTKIALSFTSPEYFMLALFGVLICGSIGGKDLVIKGWIAGLLGLFFAIIGQDDIFSIPRFMYGNSNLLGGIQIIPAMIGFYAIPEVIKAFTGQSEINNDDVFVSNAPRRKMFPIMKKSLRTIIQSALIGVGIGSLPGVGEDVAAWVAYDTSKKTSKHPEEYGNGSWEGVVAPEVGNNAAIGGALIPLLTLAVPGSPPAAVLLGAFLLHGIRPGPMLTTEFPNFIYMMAALILLGVFCMWIVGLLIAKPMSKILKINPVYLMPVVAALSIIGAFAINLNFFDLVIVFLFGILGYFLDKMGYSPAPIVLGLILGRLIDDNFRRTLVVHNGSFMAFITRPISLLFLVIIIITIVRQIMNSKKTRNNTKVG